MTRSKAFLIHLILSACIGVLVLLVIRYVWFSGPLFGAMNAAGLLAILVPVDVILGPVLTLLTCSQNKSKRLIFLDLFVIISLQLTALLYGVWAVAEARPTHIVLYGRELYVVRATDINPGKPWVQSVMGHDWVFVPSAREANAELDAFLSVMKGGVVPVFDTRQYQSLRENKVAMKAIYELGVQTSSANQVDFAWSDTGAEYEDVLLLGVPITINNQRFRAVLRYPDLFLVNVTPEAQPRQ